MTPTTGKGVRLTRADWLLLLILAAVQFTNVLDFMIVMPLSPDYMEKMDLTPDQFGMVASVYGYCAAASGLLAAVFLDRFDRKRALLGLYSGLTVATLLCALAYNYPLLLLGRGLAGTFGGIVGACVMAIVGDSFHDSRRGTAMGVVMSAFSVASIVGIPIGRTLADAYGLGAPFVGIGALALVVLVAVIFVVPPMRGHLAHAAEAERVGLRELLTRSTFLRAYGLMASITMSGFILMPFVAAYLVANVKRPKSDLDYVYVFGGLATVVSMNVVGRLADRFGKLRMFRILAVLTLVPLLAFTNLPPVSLATALTVTTVFWVTSSGRMVPATALITASAAPRYRGQFLSVNATVQHLSSALAASLGGFIIGKADNKTLTNVNVVGLVAAAFAVLSVVLAGRLRPAAGDAVPQAAPEAAPEVIAV